MTHNQTKTKINITIFFKELCYIIIQVKKHKKCVFQHLKVKELKKKEKKSMGGEINRVIKTVTNYISKRFNSGLS